MYDNLLVWINLCLIAGVLFKYTRRPLLDFFNKDKIRAMKARKAALEADIEKARAETAAYQAQKEAIEKRMVEEGPRREKAIIADAEAESQRFMDAARDRLERQLMEARQRAREEMLDAAVNSVLKRFPEAAHPGKINASPENE